MERLNLDSVITEIIKKLKKVSKIEVINGSDDIPMAINILKLLEIYEKGDFYGTVAIKIVGISPRNLRVLERSYKLLEEKREFFLDKS